MCGRFSLATDTIDVMEAFPEFVMPDEFKPRYNIAPSQNVAVVANTGQNNVEDFTWGLIPSWAKDPKIGYRMINARSETLSEKSSFRTAYLRRRCLILADGFYEWRQEPGSKTKVPIYIRLKCGTPFGFAGLWEMWRPRDDASLLSCTIITTEPNQMMEQIHNRMPAILKPEAYESWLDPQERRPDELDELLRPYPAEDMTAYSVSRFVNNPRNDSPECIAPADGEKF